MTKQREILDYIIQYKIEHDGLSPSMYEIRDGLGISSTSVVKHRLDQLAANGLIETLAGKSRGIMVMGGCWTPPGNHSTGGDEPQ